MGRVSLGTRILLVLFGIGAIFLGVIFLLISGLTAVPTGLLGTFLFGAMGVVLVAVGLAAIAKAVGFTGGLAGKLLSLPMKVIDKMSR